MASKTKQLQRIIRLYREKTGKKEIDMREVAKFAVDIGWPLSEPRDPLDLLAHSFSKAARQEIRRDEVTGQPYRANHAIPDPTGQYHLWIDIDEAPRKPMLKSLINRREQMVGDGVEKERSWGRQRGQLVRFLPPSIGSYSSYLRSFFSR